MGNEIHSISRGYVSVLDETELSCYFANNAVVAYRGLAQLKSSLSEIEKFRAKKRLTVYAINASKTPSPRSVPESRGCSIMVFDGEPGDELANPEIVELTLEDVGRFAEVVFESYGYDQRLRRDSEILYERGIRRGKARIHGVLFQGKLASVCLTHRDENTMAIELVSTLPKFRKRGLASAMISRLATNASSRGHPVIWLFADSGSNAEHLYRSVGFVPINKMYVSSASRANHDIRKATAYEKTGE